MSDEADMSAANSSCSGSVRGEIKCNYLLSWYKSYGDGGFACLISLCTRAVPPEHAQAVCVCCEYSMSQARFVSMRVPAFGLQDTTRR